jgi:hypothetical protein
MSAPPAPPPGRIARVIAAAVTALGVLSLAVAVGLPRLVSGSATSTVELRPGAALLVLPAVRPGGEQTTVTIQPRVGATSRVFVGLARQRDLTAFLSGASWDEATSESSAALTHHEGTGPSPDPRESDIWVAVTDQVTPVGIDWPATETGVRVLVAAGVGAPAPAVDLTWSHPAPPPVTGPWAAIGTALTVGGLLALLLLRRRSRATLGPAAGSAGGPAAGAGTVPGDAPTQLLNRRAIAEAGDRSPSPSEPAPMTRRAARAAQTRKAEQAQPRPTRRLRRPQGPAQPPDTEPAPLPFRPDDRGQP